MTEILPALALLKRPVDPREFLQPIRFVMSDHQRQRDFCVSLEALADDLYQSGREHLAASLLEFLLVDMSLNMEDEEELIEPLLRDRALPEDYFPEASMRLHKQHSTAAAYAARTVDGLDRLAVGGAPASPLDFVISALGLVDSVIRHLDWEEETLLPLAERRLTATDKARLGCEMARRRGILKLLAPILLN